MSLDAWLTIGILVATFVALLATRLPPATVFLGALTLSCHVRPRTPGPQLSGLLQSGRTDDWRTIHGRRGYVFHWRHQPAE